MASTNIDPIIAEINVVTKEAKSGKGTYKFIELVTEAGESYLWFPTDRSLCRVLEQELVLSEKTK